MNPQLMQLFQNPQMLQQKLSEFAQQLQSSNMTPQQMVQNMLNSGKMSQAQFNQYRDIVNKFTGMNI